MNTNKQLIELKKDKGLTNQAISDLLGPSISTINSWTGNLRKMPVLSLNYLKVRLKEVGK